MILFEIDNEEETVVQHSKKTRTYVTHAMCRIHYFTAGQWHMRIKILTDIEILRANYR